MSKFNFGSFSLEIPAEWSLSSVILTGPPEEEGEADPRLAAQAANPFRTNLVMSLERVEVGVTAEAYVEKQVAGLIEAGVPRTGISDNPMLTSGGFPGLLTEQIIEGPGGELVRQLQLVVVKENIAHTIIASQLDGDSFTRMRGEFENILKSFDKPTGGNQPAGK